jgi:hypothetical protein
MRPVILHVGKVYPLFVVDVYLDLFDDFVAPKVILVENYLLDLISSIEPVNHGRICELCLSFNVLQTVLLEG